VRGDAAADAASAIAADADVGESGADGESGLSENRDGMSLAAARAIRGGLVRRAVAEAADSAKIASSGAAENPSGGD
jgi:hypothetical protein